jgi:hypothetical protein
LAAIISRNPTRSITPTTSIPKIFGSIPVLGARVHSYALSDDTAAGWFELTITNVDTKKSESYGYGKSYPSDTFQQYPMYGTGSYQIAMKGNLTKIDLDVAERRP